MAGRFLVRQIGIYGRTGARWCGSPQANILLLINLKTAKTVDLKISDDVLTLADEVIE